MIAKWIWQSLLWIVAMGALLFAPAGTLRWPAAWVFLAAMTVISLAAGSWLARTDPGLLAERMRLTAQDEQPAADKIFVPVIGGVFLIWFVAIGLDHRFHGPDFPVVLQALGLALLLVSTLFIMWVMRENSFAAPLVKVQHERGHHVVATGPYAWVRHPMYSGAILFFVGMPLLLGSGWGLAASPLFDYISRVRYRLLPGVW
jgi:protein-S-isoprenylcysteine O-methyltransferase Ste14